MATIENYGKLSVKERQYRYFSEGFKRKKVWELDRNLVSVGEISREYQVSRTAVNKWRHKYSSMAKKKERQIVESKSDTMKIRQLKEQLKEMEQLLGQKQVKIEFMEKMIELASEKYDIAFKKKSSTKRSSGIGSTGKNTARK